MNLLQLQTQKIHRSK